MLRSLFATAPLSLFLACATPAPAPAAPSNSSPTASRSACCAQCSDAAQRDPAGMDLSVKDCRNYAGADFNGGPGVDAPCVAYFDATPTRLGECWRETGTK